MGSEGASKSGSVLEFLLVVRRGATDTSEVIEEEEEESFTSAFSELELIRVLLDGSISDGVEI